MTTDLQYLDEIRKMDEEMENLIGRRVFGHVASPTPSTLRITFGDAAVAITWAEAHNHMLYLLKTAREDVSKLPWPLREPVAAGEHRSSAEAPPLPRTRR